MSFWVPLVLLVMPMNIDGDWLMVALFVVVVLAMISSVAILAVRPVEPSPDLPPDHRPQMARLPINPAARP